MLLNFGQAMKAVRREAHRHPMSWRVLVCCAGPSQMQLAFDEARRMFEGGSLKVEKIDYSTRTITLDKGCHIRFRVVDTLQEAYRNAGCWQNHIIWLFEPRDHEIKPYIRMLLRDSAYPASDMREDESTL